ncbi:MAG: O-antigen ligase family protein [Candidatus Eisenbacteria bacterium]
MNEVTDRLKGLMAGRLAAGAFLLGIVVLALIFSVNPVFGAVVFFAAALLFFFGFWLNLGLYTIIFSLNFDNLTRLSLESTMTLTKVLIILVLTLIVLRTLLRKDPQPLKSFNTNPLTVTIYIFFTFSLVSVISAHEYLIFVGQNVRRLNLVLFYLLLITLVRDARIMRRLFLVILVGAVIAGCMGVYEVATGVNILELRWGKEAVEKAAFGTLTQRVLLKGAIGKARVEQGTHRVLGLSGNPDFHAHSMIMPSMLLLLFISLSKSWLVRIAGCAAFILFLVNILASGARGGLIALALGFIVFLVFQRIRHKAMIATIAGGAVLVFVLLFFLVAPPSVYERFAFATETETITYRVGLSKMAIAMIEDHPFLGVGTGNFMTEYNRYIVASVPRSPLWTHNCFLQAWAENGIFGFLSYLGLYIFAAANALRVWRRSEDRFIKGAAATVLAIVVCYFFYAGIDPLIEHEAHWIAFALSTALLTISKKQSSEGVTA